MKKLLSILSLFCALSLFSCISNIASESSEKTEFDVTLTTNEETYTAAAAKTDKELSETQPTESSLPEIELPTIDYFTQYKSSMSADDYSALESYFPIFNENLKFTHQGWHEDEKTLETNLQELCEKDILVRLQRFTVCDLDDDGIK